jgi:hypothetical protein
LALDNNIINIVPLKSTAAFAAPAVAAQLTYRGGPLLQSVKIFSVFWGAAWQSSPASDTAAQINQFFQYIVTSPLMDQLGEYSTAGMTIGQGQFTGTTVVSDPAPGVPVDDSDIQTFLQNQISSNPNFPQPDANTLYFVFLPTGVTVTQGGAQSCQDFCGYHQSINNQIFYGVIPYPDCSGCTGGAAVIDSITQITSHELSEAITDPVPGQGWYDDSNGEIGDICAWQTKTLGSYVVQLEWSNQANSCI